MVAKLDNYILQSKLYYTFIMFKQIGGNIKILRNRKNLSQSDLGDQLNISRQQIAHYEKGDKTIPLTSIHAISEIFSIPIDYLVKLDLDKLSDSQIDNLVNEIMPHSETSLSVTNQKVSEENNSLSLLDDYFKQIVKEQLSPIEDLLRKVLVKIDLTDLKYELGEEINKVNKVIGEEQKNNSSL